MNSKETVIELNDFVQQAKSAIIFSLFDSLRDGQSFIVSSDQEPSEICRDIEAIRSPKLRWEYVENGKQRWRLRVLKSRESEMREAKAGGCCGSCGGH